MKPISFEEFDLSIDIMKQLEPSQVIIKVSFEKNIIYILFC